MEHVTKKEFTDAMKRIDARFDAVDKRFQGMDARLDAHDKRFDEIDRRFDELAAMIARGFEEIVKRLDVRDRVDKLEAKMTKVEQALHI